MVSSADIGVKECQQKGARAYAYEVGVAHEPLNQQTISGHEENDILLGLPLEMLCIISLCDFDIMHNCTSSTVVVVPEMAVSHKCSSRLACGKSRHHRCGNVEQDRCSIKTTNSDVTDSDLGTVRHLLPC